MRVQSSVTSVSWIPSEVVAGLPKAGFKIGMVHYDDPPPDPISDVDELHAAERFRFANRLAAWIEVENGQVIGADYCGRGYMSCTRVSLGSKVAVVFQPAEFPELRAKPEVSATEVRFVQTTGGRTGMPTPRPVKRKPFVQWASPTVWTTLALTIRVDGSSEHELIGASPFPRHWVYDAQGQLVAKSGLASSGEWVPSAFGTHSLWGGEDTRPLVTVAETALEHQLSAMVMRGAEKPSIRRLTKGAWLTRQGEETKDLYLLLDGVLSASVDGAVIGELGPGAIVGERAALEDGARTASLQALTDCAVAVAARHHIDPDQLAVLAESHRREVEN
jgi:hypothetical protein